MGRKIIKLQSYMVVQKALEIKWKERSPENSGTYIRYPKI